MVGKSKGQGWMLIFLSQKHLFCQCYFTAAVSIYNVYCCKTIATWYNIGGTLLSGFAGWMSQISLDSYWNSHHATKLYKEYKGNTIQKYLMEVCYSANTVFSPLYLIGSQFSGPQFHQGLVDSFSCGPHRGPRKQQNWAEAKEQDVKSMYDCLVMFHLCNVCTVFKTAVRTTPLRS